MPRFYRSRVGVKALIVRRGRVLLLKRAPHSLPYPGLWDLPGGGCEKGEPIRETLVREVFEETGLHVRPRAPVDVVDLRWKLPREREQLGVSIVFLCSITGGLRPPRLSSEHTEFAWVGRAELGRFPMALHLDHVVRAGTPRASSRSRPRAARRNVRRAR